MTERRLNVSAGVAIAIVIAVLACLVLWQWGRWRAPETQEPSVVRNDPMEKRLKAVGENEQILAYLKTYASLKSLLERLKLPAKMELATIPHEGAKKALEAANEEFAKAMLPYIEERDRLLTECRKELVDGPRPDDKSREELLASGKQWLEEKDTRNRELTVELLGEIQKLKGEVARILKTKDELPGQTFEDILNRCSAILLEQLLIDLRWQTKQLFLHWLDPIRYPEDAVPTTDLLDSTKVRKR